MSALTIALPKGRLLNPALDVLVVHGPERHGLHEANRRPFLLRSSLLENVCETDREVPFPVAFRTPD